MRYQSNYLILTFFIYQHTMQLPPPPLLAFPKSREPSPVPTGFTAVAHRQAQLLLLPVVLLLANRQNNTRNSSSGRTPKRWGHNTDILWRSDGGARKARSTEVGFLQPSKGLEAVEVCRISLDQTSTSKKLWSSQTEESEHCLLYCYFPFAYKIISICSRQSLKLLV